jgi:hypothetical protein
MRHSWVERWLCASTGASPTVLIHHSYWQHVPLRMGHAASGCWTPRLLQHLVDALLHERSSSCAALCEAADDRQRMYAHCFGVMLVEVCLASEGSQQGCNVLMCE